jgi:hypothetical protein
MIAMFLVLLRNSSEFLANWVRLEKPKYLKGEVSNCGIGENLRSEWSIIFDKF